MKKLILGVALASLVISCKKIQAGSNHGVLKMEEGAERYSDDEMKDEKMEAKEEKAITAPVATTTDSTKMTEMKEAPAKMEKVEIIEPTLQSPMRVKQ